MHTCYKNEKKLREKNFFLVVTHNPPVSYRKEKESNNTQK